VPTLFFVAYDVIIADDNPQFDTPFRERRELLELLSREYALPITRSAQASSWHDVEDAYERAREHGSSGIVLKSCDGLYLCGERCHAWLKARKERGSIVAVIRYATMEDDDRERIRELTFGVWLYVPGGDNRLVNIARTGDVVRKRDLSSIATRLRELRTTRFGLTYEVEPHLVCEISYDAIAPAPRSEARCVLRGCRVLRLRPDVDVSAIDTVDEVMRRYSSECEHRTDLESFAQLPGERR
jgi:DNA ligase-1